MGWLCHKAIWAFVGFNFGHPKYRTLFASVIGIAFGVLFDFVLLPVPFLMVAIFEFVSAFANIPSNRPYGNVKMLTLPFCSQTAHASQMIVAK